MSYLPVETLYRELSLSPIPAEQFSDILRMHAHDPVVQQFRNVHSNFRERGDEESSQAFYARFYRDQVPELNISWCEAYARVYFFPMDCAVLPELARFCDRPEQRSNVLDLGCGDALALCYLARQFPDAQFMGIDREEAALLIARRRVATLGLRNVQLVCGDAWQLADTVPSGAFDGALLRNILDDTRAAFTPYQEARFDTVRKLRALRPFLTRNARVSVSLTAYPHETPEFEARVRAELAEASYIVFPALRIPYTVLGIRRNHLWWTICPRSEEREPVGTLKQRPEYVARYHVPDGCAIPLEDAVLNEQCYINLDQPARCPRCCTDGARMIHADGPARTRVNFYKVFVRVYACVNPACRHGYAVAEVID